MTSPLAWHAVTMAALVCSSGAAIGQSINDRQSQPLSFDAALARIDDASPGLSGEDHAVRASELIAGATRSLRRPVVSASASVIEYQKTLSVDLTGPKDNAANATTDFLSQLPGQFPVGLQQIVGQVTQRVGAALPTIFGAIPDTLQYQTRDTVFRPAVTAAMPLYTGGAIPAIQAGADAAVDVARARQAGGRDEDVLRSELPGDVLAGDHGQRRQKVGQLAKRCCAYHTVNLCH